jgi:hypothetical protein
MYSFIKIDELRRSDHEYLIEEDECYYLMEYIPIKHGIYNPENDIIMNFKKKMDRKGKAEWPYKAIDTKRIAQFFIQTLAARKKPDIIFVPIPPSKVKGDPMYDDRMVQLVSLITDGCPNSEYREILSINKNMPSFHNSEDRPSPEELIKYLHVDKALCKNKKKIIVIVDDILTSGSHFKACKQLLKEQFPGSQIIGLFIGRRNIL